MNLPFIGHVDPVLFWFLVGFWAFSAIVSSMPDPTPTSPLWYTWLHNTGQTIVANIGKLPVVKNFVARITGNPQSTTSTQAPSQKLP